MSTQEATTSIQEATSRFTTVYGQLHSRLYGSEVSVSPAQIEVRQEAESSEYMERDNLIVLSAENTEDLPDAAKVLEILSAPKDPEWPSWACDLVEQMVREYEHKTAAGKTSETAEALQMEFASKFAEPEPQSSFFGAIEAVARCLGREPFELTYQLATRGLLPSFSAFSENPAIQRCKLLHDTLKVHCKNQSTLSSTSTGTEREVVIDSLLKSMFPPQYRFDQGEIVDHFGKKTDQLDVVIEYPFIPSLPVIPGTPRMYFAGGVALVLEVKSNLDTDWNHVIKKAKKVRVLQRDLGELIGIGGKEGVTPSTLPFFVIGFKGWSQKESLDKKLAQTDLVDCAFIIEKDVCSTRPGFRACHGTGLGTSLLAFLANVQMVLSAYPIARPDVVKFANSRVE